MVEDDGEDARTEESSKSKEREREKEGSMKTPGNWKESYFVVQSPVHLLNSMR